MEFLWLSRRRFSAQNVPSGEERGETDVFAGYSWHAVLKWETKLAAAEAILVVSCKSIPAKLTSVQLCRHSGSKDLWCVLFCRVCFHNNLLEQNSQTITTADSVTEHRSAAYENQVNVQKKRIAIFFPDILLERLGKKECELLRKMRKCFNFGLLVEF